MVAAEVNGRPVVLLLPGQGSQQPGMLTGLYRREPAFAKAMDAVFDAMGPAAGPLRADWLAERPEVPIHQVTRSAPLLFAVDYALGRMLMDAGLRPDALLGHSIGEWAAATLAGVYELGVAAPIACERAERMAETPPGGMLAVAAGADELREFLGWPDGATAVDGLSLAVINAPRQVVLAGLTEALAAVADRLAGAGFTVRKVPAGTAFHSPALADMALHDRELLARVPAHPARIPLYSSCSGGSLAREQIADPAFWAGVPAAPVLFWPALDAVVRDADVVLVECGPGQQLSTLARRHRAVVAGRSAVVPLSPGRSKGHEEDQRALRAAVERLRAEGHRIKLG